jgi:hypothetical protein
VLAVRHMAISAHYGTSRPVAFVKYLWPYFQIGKDPILIIPFTLLSPCIFTKQLISKPTDAQLKTTFYCSFYKMFFKTSAV